MVYASWLLAMLSVCDSELQDSLIPHQYSWYCPHVYGGHGAHLVPQCSWLTKLVKKEGIMSFLLAPAIKAKRESTGAGKSIEIHLVRMEADPK